MNTQYFSESDVNAGVMTEFIEMLTKQSYQSDFKSSILIEPVDCGAFEVSWIQASWEYIEEYPTFKEVRPDEFITHEVILPDNTFVLSDSEDTDKKIWTAWEEKHPDWQKDDLGWYRVSQENDSEVNDDGCSN